MTSGSPVDYSALGQRGGIASGEARRALSVSARERLRRLADEDEQWWELLKGAYRGGLEATDENGVPDVRTRVATANSFLAECLWAAAAGDHR